MARWLGGSVARWLGGDGLTGLHDGDGCSNPDSMHLRWSTGGCFPARPQGPGLTGGCEGGEEAS